MLTIDRDRAAIGPGRRVLDLGCGAGRHTFDALRASAEVIALDASLTEVSGVDAMVSALGDAGEHHRERFGPLVADGTSMPFRSGTFDVVVASEVLEHVRDDRDVIAEIERVVRPGGVVAVSVPRWGPERLNWLLSRAYHEVEGGHVRIYRRRDLQRSFARVGLEVVATRYRHGLHSPYWWLRCLVGVDRPDHRLVAAYHRFLVWDIERAPRLTRFLDALLNPIVGKSLVLYCKKPA